MDFIIGGSHQGKKEYVMKHYHYESVSDGKNDDLEHVSQADIILNYHLLMKRLLQTGMKPEEMTEFLGKCNPKVIVADEIGYGLVPMDPFERKYREAAGRQCCRIAKQANRVIRIVCGIPTTIKEAGIEILFIRHGLTKGNEEGRYVGTTDEPLSEKGKDELGKVAKLFADFRPDIVLVSPMRRCVETAGILFQDRLIREVDDFRECEFGDFEYKNYHELNGNMDYQKFIDSGGMTGFPNGELPEVFRARCQEAFRREMQVLTRMDGMDITKIAIVVHGGTIMAILDAFSEPHKDYFSWQAKNGTGFIGKFSVNKVRITDVKSFARQQ